MSRNPLQTPKTRVGPVPFFTIFERTVPQICALPMKDLRFLENISVLQSGEALCVYSVVRGMLKTSGARLKRVPVFRQVTRPRPVCPICGQATGRRAPVGNIYPCKQKIICKY